MLRILSNLTYITLQLAVSTSIIFVTNITLFTAVNNITVDAFRCHNCYKWNVFRVWIYTPEPLSKRFCTTRAGKTLIIQRTQELASKSSLIVQLRYDNFKEYHSNLLRNSLNNKFNTPQLTKLDPKSVDSSANANDASNISYTNDACHIANKGLGEKKLVLKTIKNTLFEIAMANAGYNVEKYSISLSNMFLFILDCNMVPQIMNFLFKFRNGNKFFRKNLTITNAWFSNIMLTPERVEQLRYLPQLKEAYCKISGKAMII